MAKFNIGDTVKVVDTGKSYTTYATWAKAHRLQNYACEAGAMLPKGAIAVVVAKGKHTEIDVNLLGLSAGGEDYIIDERGVEMTTSSVKAMLTNGRRVRLRNNEMFTIIDDALVSLDNNWSLALKYQSATVSQSYNEVVNNLFRKEFDIVQIYERPASVVSYFNYAAITDTIWQRKEKTVKQLKMEELQKKAQEVADEIKKLQDEE